MGYQKLLSEFKTVDLDDMRKPGFLETLHKSSLRAYEKVSQNSGFKDRSKCPICNSTQNSKEFTKHGIDVVCCKKCTARYVTKVPVNLGEIYSDNVYLPRMQKGYLDNGAYRKARFYKERIGLILQHTRKKKNMRLLDVGCGTGGFLDAAKGEGFEVYGQDLGKDLAEWTRKRLGIQVFDMPIERIPKSLKFDVITLFDVLEHVTHPPQFILELKKHLNKNGIILIYVPHFDSLSSHVMRDESNHVTPCEHLTYFTEDSIRTLAKRTNFSVEYFRTCGIDLGDLKSYYEWKGDKALALACAKLYDVIQPVIDGANAGNHLRCILREKK
jgi:2-polyprenyl-3-methyl-5-hydroxy-6-metoxy-1,4-benzoquinol methylase